jgi:N-acetylglucosamine-6-phosphate deacetylase
MAQFTLSGPTLLPGGDIAPAIVILDGETIRDVTPGLDARAGLTTGGVIAPGFIDLQVNGAYGCDFTVDPASIAPVAARLPETGVTGFLPTCITSPIESYAGWLDAAHQAALDARSERCARVLGVHLEGVYFSPHKAGAHNPALLRPVDVEEILARYARHPSVRVVTLAPELPGALDAIRALVERGIIVSAGHSNATYAEAEQAIAAGIRWGTHLFNAMHDLRHREPGLPAALLLSDIPVGLIVDGVHLHPAVVKLVYRLKGAGGITLVTDAMAAMGNAPGTYNLGGYAVNVDEVSARLPNGTLAGSILTMDGAVRNVIVQSGCTLAEALRMASASPAALLGLEQQGRIAPGCDADLVLLDGALHVQATLVRGEIVYRREEQP